MYIGDYNTTVVSTTSGKCAMKTYKLGQNAYFKIQEKLLGVCKNKTDFQKSRCVEDKGRSAGKKAKKGGGAGIPDRRPCKADV